MSTNNYIINKVLCSILLIFSVFSPALSQNLVNSAAVNGLNGAQIHFNDVYRLSAHNVYKPGIYNNLAHALNKGVRVLEVDVYNSAWCTASIWQSCPSQNSINAFLKTTLQNVMAGQAVPSAGIARRRQNLEVKHSPTSEDRLEDTITPIAEIVSGSDFYGNNCNYGTAPRAGFLASTQLSGCLQEIKTWMDSNPGHSPIMLSFDIKQDMSAESAMAFDIVLRAVFGETLFTPQELKGGYESPRARVQTIGWPSMQEMHGRVIAIYGGGEVINSGFNGTLLKYLDRLKSQGVASPASFVCPRARNTSHYNFPFGAMTEVEDPTRTIYAKHIDQVVCYNFYTGTRASTQQANEVPFQQAMNLADMARADRFLSYVWSYGDLLAVYPEVAIEFVRRGVNWFDSEESRKALADGRTKSPIGFLTRNILPMEGLAGFTNYSFVLRQRNNSANIVLTKTGSSVEMQPYTGAAAQQWTIDDSGRLYSMADRGLCIGFPAQTLAPLIPVNSGGHIERDYRVRGGSFYNFNHSSNPALPYGYSVAPDTVPAMVPCDDIPHAKAMTLAPASRPFEDRPSTSGGSDTDSDWGDRLPGGPLPGGGNPTSPFFTATSAASDNPISVVIQLNPRANRSDKPLYLTPGTYAAGGTLAARARMYNRYAFGSSAVGFAPPGSDPIPPTRPVRDGANLMIEEITGEPDDSITQPASDMSLASTTRYVYLQEFELLFDRVHAQLVKPELASVTPPRAYFATLPNLTIIPALPANATWRDIPLLQENWDVVTNSSLPAVEKIIWYWAYTFEWDENAHLGWISNNQMYWQYIYRSLGSVPDDASGVVTWQVLARNFLSREQYEKWTSAVATRPEDVPTLSPTRPDARALLGNEEFMRHAFYGAYNTRVAASGPVAYWQVRNHKDLWLLAEMVLPAAEKEKWAARLKYRESDFYLDDGVAYIAEQLLERSMPLPHVEPDVTSEYGKWLAERQVCTPETCARRYRPHANWPEWRDVPFEPKHAILAEAAFNSPDVLHTGKHRPADWALWNKATSLKAALSPNEVTYRDIPVDDDDFLKIVNESGFISAGERSKYLERRRLERDYVSQNRPILHLDVDPDAKLEEVARQYLSAAEFLLWQERTAVTLNDVPVGASFAAHPAYHKLLSAREKQEMTEIMAQPDFVSAPMPTVWFEAVPANNRRFAAQHLLSPAEYAKWLHGVAATQADFPPVFINSYVEDIAIKTLDPGEYAAWREKVGQNPPQMTNLRWLMTPLRASATTIAERVLPNAEAATWKEMLGKTILPQHLGLSAGAANFARSVLSPEGYNQWQAMVQVTNMPLDWRAFRYDRSVVQERIVEGVFGKNSENHLAWRNNP